MRVQVLGRNPGLRSAMIGGNGLGAIDPRGTFVPQQLARRLAMHSVLEVRLPTTWPPLPHRPLPQWCSALRLVLLLACTLSPKLVPLFRRA